jgi:putative oxidoreductase
MKAKHWIMYFIVLTLVGLFLYTSISKIIDFDKFIWQINNQVFDNRFTPALVYGIPAAEILIAILLPWSKTRRVALYCSAFLMTIFTIYIGMVTFNVFERTPCGCATAFEKLSWPQHLLMNLAITILNYIAISIDAHDVSTTIKQGKPKP